MGPQDAHSPDVMFRRDQAATQFAIRQPLVIRMMNEHRTHAYVRSTACGFSLDVTQKAGALRQGALRGLDRCTRHAEGPRLDLIWAELTAVKQPTILRPHYAVSAF